MIRETLAAVALLGWAHGALSPGAIAGDTTGSEGYTILPDDTSGPGCLDIGTMKYTPGPCHASPASDCMGRDPQGLPTGSPAPCAAPAIPSKEAGCKESGETWMAGAFPGSFLAVGDHNEVWWCPISVIRGYP